ncbi:hypothetical protein QBC34DRAFT_446072 [Podospora aff. communis PSN243]|uniref:DUF6546 domain-containing protein n=1 Tax=Podospora aff. communis PSN243 TaxID=3040156 RepID=A0AAV9H0C1_9PEZI|nr:hypothetical protein QBC34DRAFT_446072 [Podospora aff. communis PSN243]
MVSLSKFKLEHLGASCFVDARHFFDIDPPCEWPNLTSFVPTSKELSPGEEALQIGAMLRLETIFPVPDVAQRRQATVTWRATWERAMEPSLIRAWEVVVHHRYDDGWSLGVVQEQRYPAIKSHGDGFPALIQMVQKALEGVDTV